MKTNLFTQMAALPVLLSVLATETVKPRGVHYAGSLDRRLLALTALQMIAETQDDRVSRDDILTAAWMFSMTERGQMRVADSLVDALRHSQ